MKMLTWNSVCRGRPAPHPSCWASQTDRQGCRTGSGAVVRAVQGPGHFDKVKKKARLHSCVLQCLQVLPETTERKNILVFLIKRRWCRHCFTYKTRVKMQNHTCPKLQRAGPFCTFCIENVSSAEGQWIEGMVRNTLPLSLKLREFWIGSAGMHLNLWNFLNCIKGIDQSTKFTFIPLNPMVCCLHGKNYEFCALKGRR